VASQVSLIDPDLSAPALALLTGEAPQPSFATNLNASFTLGSYLPGATTGMTVTFDMTAGDLRLIYSDLYIPKEFAVDLNPPPICSADFECLGGICSNGTCTPRSCSIDDDCPPLDVGSALLPGFCFTPSGGGPSACRISCNETPAPPIGGICSGADLCPGSNVCSSIEDDLACGCTATPMPNGVIGAFGLDTDLNGTIDYVASIKRIDEEFAYMDSNGDDSIDGEPLLLHRAATDDRDHHIAIFTPPDDAPPDPDSLVSGNARAYLIMETGTITNPALPGDYDLFLRIRSVDPDSAGNNDLAGEPPVSVTLMDQVTITGSQIFTDGFESGDTSARSDSLSPGIPRRY